MQHPERLVITIVGPESSGKSTLGEYLAKELKATFVPEYARKYLENFERPYDFEDLEIIAKGQLDSEEQGVFGHRYSVFGKRSSVFRIPNPFNRAYLKHGQFKKDEFLTWLKSFNTEIVIIDAGMLTMRMWALIKYGKTIPKVEKFLENDHTSLYILCKPGREWEFDPLREAPQLIDRVWIYNQYLKELVKVGKNWISIKVNL
jgi:nicotinamide riboside kinase